MEKEKKKWEFTLNHLLIIVIIVGVLVAIGVPILTEKIETVQNKEQKNIRNMYTETLSDAYWGGIQ